MALHLIKLCVGAPSIENLARWQKHRLETVGEIVHTTRMTPRRRDDVLDGGSLYWVIKGHVQVRQKLLDLREFVDDEGIGRCDLVLHKKLVPTDLQPRRPFQGWRYLQAKDAPDDRVESGRDDGLPPQIRAELREIGVL